MQIRELDVVDLCVVLALSGALLLTILRGQEELAMSITGGLMGYIGAGSRAYGVKNRTATRCPLEAAKQTDKEERK